MALQQSIAVDPPGHEAVLDRDLGMQFVHQEQADHKQQQDDRDAAEACRLSVGGLVVLLDKPGALLLHTSWYLTADRGVESKSRLQCVNEPAISAAS